MKTLELPQPAVLTAAERAAEITAMLAAAITRTYVAETPTEHEFQLDSYPMKSVHVLPSQMEKWS